VSGVVESCVSAISVIVPVCGSLVMTAVSLLPVTVTVTG
jgi:hypothetical protein